MAEITIQPIRNGPYVLSGDVKFLDSDGKALDVSAKRNQGKVFLCRCGQSSTKPFCDGTHQKVAFKSEIKG